LNPQHPDWQSLSDAQDPVMNCVPGAFPDPIVESDEEDPELEEAVLPDEPPAAAAEGVDDPEPTVNVPWPSLFAALAFGVASP
jgi:hypothetical protein